MSYISVIIPCYNAAGYITRCLDALEKQTFQDFDVILVDDCSADNTVDVIRGYSKDSNLHITVLQNAQNMGPGASRNNGVAHSQSQYLCFCDSDDWYDSDYLALMSEASAEAQADMVLCNSRKITANGSVDIVLFKKMSSATPKQVLALGIDSLCNLMVRREIAAAVPLPHLRNGEDMAVVPLMVMRCRKFGFVEDCIYNYLCRPGSLSLTASAGVSASLERSFAHIVEHQISGFDREVEFIGIKNLVYGGLLNYFKVQKDKAYACQLLDTFQKQYPQWYNNPYCKTLPLFKKVFLFFAKKRWFLPIRLMCYVHRMATAKE